MRTPITQLAGAISTLPITSKKQGFKALILVDLGKITAIVKPIVIRQLWAALFNKLPKHTDLNMWIVQTNQKFCSLSRFLG